MVFSEKLESRKMKMSLNQLLYLKSLQLLRRKNRRSRSNPHKTKRAASQESQMKMNI